MPGQTFDFRNNGMGVGPSSDERYLYVGVAEKGTQNVVSSFARVSDVVDTHGQGDLSEDLAYHIANAGGPVLGLRTAASVAASNSAVTKVAIGTSTGTITIAGTALLRATAKVEIMKTGALGVGEFRYYLDGKDSSYSPALLIPAGGTYVIANSGITLTFVPGAGPVIFEKGDTHTFTTTPAYFNTTDLATAITAIKNSTTEFDVLVLSGAAADATTAASLFAAFATHLATLEGVYKFAGGIIDIGSSDTASNVDTAMAAQANDRPMGVYGKARRISAKPFTGWAEPMLPPPAVLAVDAANMLFSADLKRLDVGQLRGVTEIAHDETYAATSLGTENKRITVLRTWLGRPGFFVHQGYIKSAPTSDYRLWPHRRVMDRAARLIYLNQQGFIGANPRTYTRSKKPAGEAGANGTIVEADALGLEAPVQRALRSELLEQKNQDGNDGHVSDFHYEINRTVDILTAKKLTTDFAAVPLAYIDDAKTVLRYTLSIG